MPRLPVDGVKVIEYRHTLGTFERQQLERFIDGLQIRNIGTGIGAATDPVEALFSTTTGSVGGLFLLSWALKRFFGFDVPIPTDLEDLSEGWAILVGSLNDMTTETREGIDNYIDSIDLKEKAELFGVIAAVIPGLRGVALSTRLLKRAADFIFSPLDSPRFDPNYGDIYADYVDPGLETGGQVGIPPAQVPPTEPGEIPSDYIDPGLAQGSQNPFNLTAEQRDCVLEKLNLHAANVPPYQSEQNVIQAMVQICGLGYGKAGNVYKAFQEGSTI
ncbi:MAG: hypothetical protein ACO23R_17595 [bacterium]